MIIEVNQKECDCDVEIMKAELNCTFVDEGYKYKNKSKDSLTKQKGYFFTAHKW